MHSKEEDAIRIWKKICTSPWQYRFYAYDFYHLFPATPKVKDRIAVALKYLVANEFLYTYMPRYDGIRNVEGCTCCTEETMRVYAVSRSTIEEEEERSQWI